jgi:hypothetical protein
MQNPSLRKFIVVLAATAALAAPPAVLAAGFVDQRPGFGSMLVDGVVVRPLGLGAMVLGAATWVVTLPFSALGGNVDEATQKLLVEPARFTFVRPLGEL